MLGASARRGSSARRAGGGGGPDPERGDGLPFLLECGMGDVLQQIKALAVTDAANRAWGERQKAPACIVERALRELAR